MMKRRINTDKYSDINSLHIFHMNGPDNLILCDVDGVLLDWAAGFDNWMIKQGYVHRVGSETAYLMEDRFENITREEGRQRIREFNESTDIGNLSPLRDAVEGVAKLVSLGFNFAIISSHSDLDAACDRREQCLKDIFGKDTFSYFVHLETGSDKDIALASYQDADAWWIEDKTENALAGARVGLRSILVHHDFNADDQHEELTRVHTWNDIVELITKTL